MGSRRRRRRKGGGGARGGGKTKRNGFKGFGSWHLVRSSTLKTLGVYSERACLAAPAIAENCYDAGEQWHCRDREKIAVPSSRGAPGNRFGSYLDA